LQLPSNTCTCFRNADPVHSMTPMKRTSGMRLYGWRTWVSWLLLQTLAPHIAVGAASSECIPSRSAFDGTSSLSYASVVGGWTGKIYVHTGYPTRCDATHQEMCRTSTYLLSRDVVAVGKTCGAWSYIQYIGQKRVTTGWIAAEALAPEKRNTYAPPIARTPEQERRYRFSLVKGGGTPVCTAYLQRLNLTVYPRPPYCDRPESDEVPGFTILKRVYLHQTETVPLPDLLFKLWNPPNPALSGNWAFGPNDMQAWRYGAPVDIANNRRPLNILVWRGAGLSGGFPCGAPGTGIVGGFDRDNCLSF